MAIYFVDPASGDDANDGLSPAAAFKTVGHATAGCGRRRAAAARRFRIRPGDGVPGDTGRHAEEPIVIEPYAGTDGRVRRPDHDPGLRLRPQRRVGAGRLAATPRSGGAGRSSSVPDRATAARVRYGAFVDSRIRLITYSRIEDLRATNESFRAVPLTDPREAGGPLVDDPTPQEAVDVPRARPASGCSRTRTIPTTGAAASTCACRGPTCAPPARATTPARAIRTRSASPSAPRAASPSRSGPRNVVLRNLDDRQRWHHHPQRDGRRPQRDVRPLHGLRRPLRGPRLRRGRRRHLPPLHVRRRAGAVDRAHRRQVRVLVHRRRWRHRAQRHSASETHDILVISHGGLERGVRPLHVPPRPRRAAARRDLDVVRAPLPVRGPQRRGRAVLRAVNAHVFKNLFRQVLHPFSFALEEGGGPIFIYRNVVDQRLPTRGFRVLPPDAPAPHIFRYGASYKTATRCRTCTSTRTRSSLPIATTRRAPCRCCSTAATCRPTRARVHLNNLIVGLDLDLPYTWADDAVGATPLGRQPVARAATSGRRRRLVPAARTVRSSRSAPSPGSASSAGRSASTFAEPGLVNFDDEIFEHGRYLGDDFPHNDWRPAQGSPARARRRPAARRAVRPRPSGGWRPARHRRRWCSAALALRVGVDDAVVLPTPDTPVARAGPDQLVIDTDGDGFVDGHRRRHAGAPHRPARSLGTCGSSNGSTLATQPIATLTLPEGRPLPPPGGDQQPGPDRHRRPARRGPAAAAPRRQPRPQRRLRGGVERLAARQGDHRDRRPSTAAGGPCASTPPAASSRNAPRHARDAATRSRRGYDAPTFLGTPIRVGAVFLDAAGRRIATREAAPSGATTSYAYRQGDVVAPAEAVAMDLVLGGDAPATAVFVDDVRVLDDNLLANAGFEIRAPTGRDDDAPHWRFEAGGARVVTAPEPSAAAPAPSPSRGSRRTSAKSPRRSAPSPGRRDTGSRRGCKTDGITRHRRCRPASTRAATMSSPTRRARARSGSSAGSWLRRPAPSASPSDYASPKAVGIAYFDDLLVTPVRGEP